jgi:hypothetical protein
MMKNPFQIIIGKHNKEAYHDRLIRWMADPREDHGQRDRFVELWLSEVFGVEWDDNVLEAKNEFKLLDAGYCDIGIVGKRKLVLIENKISMGAIRPDQIPKYAAAANELCKESGKRFFLSLLAPRQIEFDLGESVKSVSWDRMSQIIREWSQSCRAELNWLDHYCEFCTRNTPAMQATVSSRETNRRERTAAAWTEADFFEAVRDFASTRIKDVEKARSFEMKQLELYEFLLQNEKLDIDFGRGPKTVSYNAYLDPKFIGGRKATVLIGVYHTGLVWCDSEDKMMEKYGITSQDAETFRNDVTGKVWEIDLQRLETALDELIGKIEIKKD